MLTALTTVAGDALAGPTPCSTSVSTATCTGNQSAGIASGVDFFVPPVTTLNVNNLTQAIAPAANTDGISFFNRAGGSVTIDSNTGSFGIITTGTADGIAAESSGGAVTVTSTGRGLGEGA